MAGRKHNVTFFVAAAAALSLLLLGPALSVPAKSSTEQSLPDLDPASDFSLTDENGRRVSLHDYIGKVVAVAFIYTYCPDVCPMLTDKMARVQDELGEDFGRKIAFLSITIDPEHDTPAALKQYGAAFGAKPGWSFLTGTPAEITAAEKNYGIYAEPAPNGGYSHLLLTSVIDKRGVVRTQYLGFDFNQTRRL